MTCFGVLGGLSRWCTQRQHTTKRRKRLPDIAPNYMGASSGFSRTSIATESTDQNSGKFEKVEEQMEFGRKNHCSLALTSGKPRLLSPAVQQLEIMARHDAHIHQLFTQAFQEVPRMPQYELDPGGHSQVRDFASFLQLLDHIVTTAPEFNSTIMSGFPINAILAWPMATRSGIAVFLHEKVNAHIRNILDAWATLLYSPESAYVLNDDPEHGWLGSKALVQMPNFADEYICNPLEPHHGFRSWDAFFTRKLRAGVRPVEGKDDTCVIVSACESTPYRIAFSVKSQDRFWMKDQSYSLKDMLAGDTLAPLFHGGTVYQAYLDPTNYHRWHSPVSGVIRKAYVHAGAYYAQCPAVGFDRSAPNKSQAYLTHVATRAMIFIEADNPSIGLLCFMPVGMTECSTCELTVGEGQRVEKGEDLGMFHYGGSTWCLILRPQTRLQFQPGAREVGSEATVIRVNSALATVQ
ncbi:MAG: hypothetical protein Q9220_000887 [cf. Caloplaca sp. 1 TL-2023]